MKTQIFPLKETIKVVCQWHGTLQRSFPWRQTVSPFHVLTAEFMLQRTTPTRVIPVFEDFIKKIYKPKSALQKRNLVKTYFESLGLRKRAGLFLKTCEVLCKEYQGEVPSDYESLIGLPGVGDYTAAAVMLFGFNLDVIPVDTNVARCFSRSQLFEIKRGRKRSLIGVSNIFPDVADITTWNALGIAIIDLALVICRKNPICSKCPLCSRFCNYPAQIGLNCNGNQSFNEK